MNRFFTPNTNDPNLNDILSECVEDELKPIRLDGLVGVCKLPLNYEEGKTPGCLIGVPEFTHEEIIIEINTNQWKGIEE